MNDTPDILFNVHPSKQGDIGIITLNRPAALNALSHPMVQAMQATLIEWQDNPNIQAILLQAAGDKAFCAGGDIRQLYNAALSQDNRVFDFFSEEYNLNYFLASLKKPIISLLNGITMGGGVGISHLGGQRVATEKYVFAMPETGIGFFPDVGGSYFLPRLPYHAGFYLALTGTRIKADAAKELGLVDVVVASEHIEQVKLQIIELDWQQPHSLQQALADYAVPSKPSELSANYSVIDDCFQANSIEEIIARLEKCATPFAKATLDTLQLQSPTSLKVTLEQCHRGKSLDIAACLQMEYRMVQQFFHQSDFVEGIRAAIIDKDRQPKWNPNQITSVTATTVAAFFAKQARELKLNSHPSELS